MRKVKNPKFGEYVLVCRWGDHDPHDPWYIGALHGITKSPEGKMGYKVHQCERWFQHCFRLTNEEGREWIELYGDKSKTIEVQIET